MKYPIFHMDIGWLHFDWNGISANSDKPDGCSGNIQKILFEHLKQNSSSYHYTISRAATFPDNSFEATD